MKVCMGGGGDMTLVEIKETLKTIFAMANKIHSLQISGGEPLLMRNIAEIVNECCKYTDQFDELLLFTNATINLKEDFLQMLQYIDKKLKFYISNYGLYPENVKAFIKKLIENNINYIEIKYYGEEQHCGGFVDYGEYKRHNRSHEELKSLFLSCGQAQIIRCHPTIYGRIHYCPFSLGGTERGIIPSKKNIDYLDVFDTEMSFEDKCKWFSDIASIGYLTACDYCSGDFGTLDGSKRRPAGEQFG
jgi:hypothetical protein